MLALVKHLDKDKLQPRTYVVASTDRMGAQKAQAAEQEFQASKVLCSAACRNDCLLRCILCQPLLLLFPSLKKAWQELSMVRREAKRVRPIL